MFKKVLAMTLALVMLLMPMTASAVTWDTIMTSLRTSNAYKDGSTTATVKGDTITVSGGEPLLQLEFLTELFEKAKQKGVNTCIDTAAGPFTREEPWFGKFRKLMDVTDLLLLDLKHIDSAAHKALTGADNANVLDCAKYLSEIGKPVWIRHVLVPGINSDEPSLAKLSAFIRTLANVKRVEVLPYHTLGVPKWKSLGLPYTFENIMSPTAEQCALAERILCCERWCC